MTYQQSVRRLYDATYARDYRALYIDPWRRKHDLNVANLQRLLARLPEGPKAWLDMACGQAWHFSAVQMAELRQVGVDLSEAQLEYARRNCPNADLVLGDLLTVQLPAASFDLMTSFWGGYCYLATTERIDQWLSRALGWLKPGGTLYMEVLLAQDLAAFNVSKFAGATGFRVNPGARGYPDWTYEDVAGVHEMTSPPAERFLAQLAPHFRTLEAEHDGGFMVHLVASGHREA